MSLGRQKTAHVQWPRPPCSLTALHHSSMYWRLVRSCLRAPTTACGTAGVNRSDSVRYMFKIRLNPTVRQQCLWDTSDLTPEDYAQRDHLPRQAAPFAGSPARHPDDAGTVV